MARRGDGISPRGQGRGEGWAMAGTAPRGFTYPPEPPCGLGRALERVLQANPALRERVEASQRAGRMDLFQRLARALKVKAWRR